MEYNTKEYINSLKLKYKTYGLSEMSELEVLELLLLYSKVSCENVHDVAVRLMERFYTLSCIFERSPQTLMETEGVNAQTAILLNMQSSLFRVYEKKRTRARIKMLNDENSGDFIRSLFIGCGVEQFYAVMMSSANKILSVNLLFSGTINRTSVYTRSVIELTLQCGADKVLFIHNHPNGAAMPSQEDVMITYDLQDALAAIGAQIYDHIIVTEKELISLKNDMHIFDTYHSVYEQKI